MHNSDQVCQKCRKSISKRARANVFGDQIVCTPCWNALDTERRRLESEAEDLIRPASEAQLKYANDLGLRYPSGLTWQEMHDVLERHLNLYDDPIAPSWLKSYAISRGLRLITSQSGDRQLSTQLARRSLVEGDHALARWFAVCVLRDLMEPHRGDPFMASTPEALDHVATILAANAQAMRSIKRVCESDTFGWFGDEVFGGGSRTTGAYKVAKATIVSLASK